MPSSQFVLAYYSKKALEKAIVAARADAAADYVRSLHRKPCVNQEAEIGAHSGILSWSSCDDTVGWPEFQHRGDETAAWVGIPEHDAMSDSGTDSIELARVAIQPGFERDTLGAPYACIYLSGEQLVIANDSLGLARLYEFDFGEIVVWATRPGLAHIFAGEYVKKNDAAWSGMATLGWNAGGYSHVGSGKQISGSRYIKATPGGGVVREDQYSEWVHRAPEKGSSWSEASAGMVQTMSLGHYFAKSPIADLSGGKDSRLLAAAALTSGVTDTVRTVRSDHGEVETAERLVALYSGEITHLVTEVSAPKVTVNNVDLDSHVAATIRGNEGATVAATALRGPSFSGYTPLTVARFNGHGGEALHGGEYANGVWKDKLAGKGLSAALDRMVAMVTVARGTSELGRERTIEIVRNRLETGKSMGIDSANGLLNYFYSAERMPFWASSSPNRAVITPYYSSGLLHHIARTFTEETEFKQFYAEILSSLIAPWAEVPFYRPSGGARRASRYFWENFDWAAMRSYVLDRADSSENFDGDAVRSLVEDVDSGVASKRIEVSLSRFIWEMSLDHAVDDINARVGRARQSGFLV